MEDTPQEPRKWTGRKTGKSEAAKKLMRELAVHRLIQDLSYSEVGALLGIGRTVIYRWEEGINNPMLDSAVQYADALGLKFVLVPKDEED